MSKLYFSASDSLLTIIKKVQAAPDSQLTLEIPLDNIFWQGSVNKKLLEALAADQQKKLIWPGPNTPEPKKTPAERPVQPQAKTRARTQGSRATPKKVILILLLIFGLFGSSALAFVYYYLPRAEITLTVEEKTLESLEQVELVPDLTEISVAQNKVPSYKLSLIESEEETFAATGEKQVGDKASGTVTVQNWTDAPISLPAGTILVAVVGSGDKDLSFATTKAVLVPAQSVTQPEPGKKLFEAGVANVRVEAARFGSEYNLSANTNFRVGSFDTQSVSASNGNSFSGGTTKQVTIVSADDLSRSANQLSAKLFAQGRLDLKSKLMGDQVLIDKLTKHTILSQNASAQEGDETSQFKIKMETQTKGLAYSASELKTLVLEKLSGLVPPGFQISTNEKVITLQQAEKTAAGSVNATVKIKTLVIPDLSLGELKQKLLGKRLSQAINILSHQEKLVDYQIQTWPLLPDFLRTLPHRSERLNIQVKSS